ncbi:MAG: peptide ABC transporter substrate-binding protein [Candidatus Velthaea sp.]
MGDATLPKTFALIVAAGLLAACSRVPDAASAGAGNAATVPSPGARHAYTRPHELRYATAEDISGLNPHLVTQGVVFYMASLTMAWLVKTGPDSKPVPELATEVPTLANGGVSRDGRTITYHLRKDAKWSDGTPFTAGDVVFSVKTILNPATNEVGRDGWDLITKMDEPDQHTVVLHLKKKYSPYAVTFFSSAGANPCVLPKHLLEKLSNINNAEYNALPVGIGPFKYASWKRGDAVEMVPDPLYFRGQPKLRKITFKIVPDRNTVLTQLTTHEIDLWTPISASFYDRVKTLAGVNVVRRPAFQYNHMDFNTSHPIVSDRRVRAALRYGMDRDQIRVKIRHGLGRLSDNIFGPNHPAYHPIPVAPFDLARGKALLEEAGWKPGPDGVRVKNATRLALVVATSSGTPDTDQQIELIRATWKQLGVELTVRRYLSALMFAQPSGVVYSGKFDVIFFAWTLDSFGDLSQLYGCAAMPPHGQNDSRWCNPRADAAMHAFKEEYDEAKRNPYDYAVTDEIARDVPIVVLDVRDDIYAYNTDMHGWHPNPVAPFDDFMNVDI